MKWNIMFTTEFFHENLITVRLLVTQVKITVDGLDMIVQLLQDKQQGHTVGTPTDGHEMETSGRKQRMLRDEIGYFIQHTGQGL
jgi:hypothetical protein